VRNGGHDASAIACIFFESAAAAMIHPGVDMVGVGQDFVAGSALNVSHEANTTGVLLESRVVETMLSGKPDFAIDSFVHHAFNSFGSAISNRKIILSSKRKRS
jgi:hypothetical protein